MGGRGASSGAANPLVEKTLQKIIKNTQNLKKEQFRVLSKNGDILYVQKGDKDRARLQGLSREIMEDGITIHNHPEQGGGYGGPFSPEDLWQFGWGANQIVVTAPEGTYRLKNIQKKGTPDWISLRDGLNNVLINESMTKIKAKATQKVDKSNVGVKLKKMGVEFEKLQKNGASREQLQSFFKKNNYDTLSRIYQQNIKIETHKLVTKNRTDFYKNNASKYGFNYSFTPNKK